MGSPDELELVLADKYAHYLSMNLTSEMLESVDIQPGDPFMGVAGDGFGPQSNPQQEGKIG